LRFAAEFLILAIPGKSGQFRAMDPNFCQTVWPSPLTSNRSATRPLWQEESGGAIWIELIHHTLAGVVRTSKREPSKPEAEDITESLGGQRFSRWGGWLRHASCRLDVQPTASCASLRLGKT
jgi:hypothetical protein